MTDAQKDPIITLAEASAMLGLHPNTLRKWDNNGFLKAIRFGPRKDRRYRKSAIIKVLKQK